MIERLAIELMAENRLEGGALRLALEAKYPGAIDRARARLLRAREEARFRGDPPAWAKRYVRKHASRRVTLTWRRSTMKGYASGHCYGDRLVVTAGVGSGAEDDARCTVLHEIAHTRAPYGDPHGPQFYDEWVRLLKAEGLYRTALGRNRGQGSGLRAANRRARTNRREAAENQVIR